MTEQEMRDRMKEIDEERNNLRREKEEYEKYFAEKKQRERAESHKAYVGKCFACGRRPRNRQEHIKAFKVIEVLDSPNEQYARCIVLVDGHESEGSLWNVKAIKDQVIGLWTCNQLRLMNSINDPKVIDFYHEISDEEFRAMYVQYRKELDERANILRTE